MSTYNSSGKVEGVDDDVPAKEVKEVKKSQILQILAQQCNLPGKDSRELSGAPSDSVDDLEREAIRQRWNDKRN